MPTTLKRLRTEGLIEADVSIVSPKAVGRHVTMNWKEPTSIDLFKTAVRNAGEVMRF